MDGFVVSLSWVSYRVYFGDFKINVIKVYMINVLIILIFGYVIGRILIIKFLGVVNVEEFFKFILYNV